MKKFLKRNIKSFVELKLVFFAILCQFRFENDTIEWNVVK